MFEYFYVIDYIEAFLWTVTYMFIALVGLINKDDTRLAMPKIALCANFAWEVASIIELENSFSHQGGYIRSAWFVFDVFILIAVFIKNYKMPDFKKRFACWFFLWVALTLFFAVGFNSGELFMPVSAFVIDVEMAILFWFQRKKFDPSLRLYIGISKLFGDILAGVYCSPIHNVIIVLAAVSFIFNVLYVVYAVKELKANPDVNDNFKNNWQTFLQMLKSKRSRTKTYQHTRTYKKKKRTKKTHRKKR